MILQFQKLYGIKWNVNITPSSEFVRIWQEAVVTYCKITIPAFSLEWLLETTNIWVRLASSPAHFKLGFSWIQVWSFANTLNCLISDVERFLWQTVYFLFTYYCASWDYCLDDIYIHGRDFKITVLKLFRNCYGTVIQEWDLYTLFQSLTGDVYFCFNRLHCIVCLWLWWLSLQE